jgi:phosphopantetheinyl transferase (holo-ACP synthase)
VIPEVVGNDVVDLTDPAIADHHRRERFLSRVCTADEQTRVATASDLWTLFAAKEAAYKALVKLGSSPGFAHRDLRVAPDLSAVRWREHELTLWVSSDGQRVHAVAWSAGARWPIMSVACAKSECGGRGASPHPWEEASSAVRALLRDLLATEIGCAARELEVVREPMAGAWDGFGPPRVERNGTRMDADVSLSHDGRFVAAAALLGTRPALRAGVRRPRACP